MNWQPNIKHKEQVDVNDPSFPWKDGKPDWGYYYLIKNAEREQRNKGKKQPKLKERCCAIEDDGMMCRVPSLGKIEVDGKLAPLCAKHKEQYE